MNSGIAEVVAVVESEKNVEFCVVSSAFDHVYDDCSCRPRLQRLRTSMIERLVPGSRRRSTSLRSPRNCGSAAGGPSDRTACRRRASSASARSRSELRQRCRPRDPAVAEHHHPVRQQLLLDVHVPHVHARHTRRRTGSAAPRCRRARSNGGTGNVGLAMTDARRRRRIRDRDDQVLLVVGVVVQAVAAPHRRAAAADHVPGRAEPRRPASRRDSRRAGRRSAPAASRSGMLMSRPPVSMRQSSRLRRAARALTVRSGVQPEFVLHVHAVAASSSSGA